MNLDLHEVDRWLCCFLLTSSKFPYTIIFSSADKTFLIGKFGPPSSQSHPSPSLIRVLQILVFQLAKRRGTQDAYVRKPTKPYLVWSNGICAAYAFLSSLISYGVPYQSALAREAKLRFINESQKR